MPPGKEGRDPKKKVEQAKEETEKNKPPYRVNANQLQLHPSVFNEPACISRSPRGTRRKMNKESHLMGGDGGGTDPSGKRGSRAQRRLRKQKKGKVSIDRHGEENAHSLLVFSLDEAIDVL